MLVCTYQGGGGEARLTIKRSLVRHIVHQENTHGTSVVSCRDGAETLLTGRIPDLELDPLAVQLDRADLEVDADGGDEGGREGVLTKAQKTA